MDDAFKIFVERLKEGEPEVLEEVYAPTFMEIEEDELRFEAPIHLEGEAFVSGDSLVIIGQVTTRAKVPCAICNEFTEVSLELPNFTHTEKVDEVKSGVYNLAPILREAILLELPSKAECKGKCPDRERVEKYLAKGGESFPFESLGEE
ncbi:MAG: hypothetical protein H7A36_06060 [Chlamydiales bacterium]|nr:hypothetical protein [Chlamydiales bacterium]